MFITQSEKSSLDTFRGSLLSGLALSGFIIRQTFDVTFGASLLRELYGIAFLTFTLPSRSSDRKVPIFCAVFESRSPFRFASEPHGNNAGALNDNFRKTSVRKTI